MLVNTPQDSPPTKERPIPNISCAEAEKFGPRRGKIVIVPLRSWDTSIWDVSVLLNELLFSWRENPADLCCYDVLFLEPAGQTTGARVKVTDTRKCPSDPLEHIWSEHIFKGAAGQGLTLKVLKEPSESHLCQ